MQGKAMLAVAAHQPGPEAYSAGSIVQLCEHIAGLRGDPRTSAKEVRASRA